MNTNDLILSSLEMVAEKKGDITAPVYQHYFNKCPESKELMWHIDHLVQGKMLDEVLRLIMIEDPQSEKSYLNFEVRTHQQSYGVQSYMYLNLFDSVKEAVMEALAEDWNADFESAWKTRINSLLEAIKLHTVN